MYVWLDTENTDIGEFLLYHQALVHKIAKERTYLRNLTHLHAVFIDFLKFSPDGKGLNHIMC